MYYISYIDMKKLFCLYLHFRLARLWHQECSGLMTTGLSTDRREQWCSAQRENKFLSKSNYFHCQCEQLWFDKKKKESKYVNIGDDLVVLSRIVPACSSCSGSVQVIMCSMMFEEKSEELNKDWSEASPLTPFGRLNTKNWVTSSVQYQCCKLYAHADMLTPKFSICTRKNSF